MNKKLELKNFDLRNLKVNSKGLLAIEWFDITRPQDALTVESDSKPHEDLLNKLNEFRTPFAKSLKLLSGWDMARENTRKNEELLREALRLYNEEVMRLNLSEVAVTEKGVYLKGTLACDDVNIKVSSPYIKFDNQESDMGSQSKSIVDELVVEVWRFIYADKRDSDLFNQKEEKKSGLNNTEEQHLKAV